MEIAGGWGELIALTLTPWRRSAEVLVSLPEFWPGKTRRAAEEDVGVVVALFVMDAEMIGVGGDEMAIRESSFYVSAGVADDDQC